MGISICAPDQGGQFLPVHLGQRPTRAKFPRLVHPYNTLILINDCDLIGHRLNNFAQADDFFGLADIFCNFANHKNCRGLGPRFRLLFAQARHFEPMPTGRCQQLIPLRLTLSVAQDLGQGGSEKFGNGWWKNIFQIFARKFIFRLCHQVARSGHKTSVTTVCRNFEHKIG